MEHLRIGRRAVASLGLIFVIAALTSLPVVGATPTVPTTWTGTAVGNANCYVLGHNFYAGTMTVSWTITFSPKTDTFSWQWSTTYSWSDECGSINLQIDQGCGGIIVPGTVSISQPNSGSGSSSTAPDFKVAPISVATYDMFCLSAIPPGWGWGPSEFSMQASTTVQT